MPALAALLLAAGAAHAQLFRAYVSPAGLDTNNCTLAAPCRLLPAALGAVADGGEIWMLESANYNTAPVQVTKSVTLLAVPGVVGSVVALGGPALVASTPGLTVTLKNLVLVPLPGNAAQTGVVFESAGGTLNVQGCEVAGFNAVGGRGIAASGPARVIVTDSILRNSEQGLFTTGGVHAAVSNTRFLRNAVGARNFTSTTATSHMTIADSFFVGNTDGVVVQGKGAANAISRATVVRTTISESTYALAADAGPEAGATATITVNASTVANNVNPVFRSSGNAVIYSLGNNQVADNASAAAFTPLAPQ